MAEPGVGVGAARPVPVVVVAAGADLALEAHRFAFYRHGGATRQAGSRPRSRGNQGVDSDGAALGHRLDLFPRPLSVPLASRLPPQTILLFCVV